MTERIVIGLCFNLAAACLGSSAHQLTGSRSIGVRVFAAVFLFGLAAAIMAS